MFIEHTNAKIANIILARNWENSKIIAIDKLGSNFLKKVDSGDTIEIMEDGTILVTKK